MATNTYENDYEKHIANNLEQEGDYERLESKQYDKALCLVPAETISFLKATQSAAYEALEREYGAQTEARILQNIDSALKTHGLLHVLRKGVRDRGQHLQLCYFQPSNSKNEAHAALYSENRFGVMQQLYYSAKTSDSIDLVLFLNGLPILTAEVKNALTGQYLTDAIKQYRQDRKPAGEPLLSFKRCVAHFAVSTELVSITTKLAGEKTFFLPFNRDIENAPIAGDFATAYLWQEVWSKGSLMDLLQNFLHLQKDTEKYFDAGTKALKNREVEKLIFPRWHQRRAVYRLLEAVKQDGPGTNYLIQHSAGSGKSNTISWLAHRLAGFFRQPEDANRMFDSILVVTDRLVLDKQLQDNIRQFEQVPGVVVCIDEKKSAQDLKAAIETGARALLLPHCKSSPLLPRAFAKCPAGRMPLS